MKTTRNILFTLLLMCLSTLPLKALSLEDVSIEGGYALGVPEDSLIDGAQGPGFELSLRWRLSDRWSLILNSSHWYLSIDQENAHRVLDWPYWQQIYGFVIYQVETDPVYEVDIEPYQDLKIKPVEAGLAWRNSKSARFQFGGELSGGPVWFRRQLYIEEFWKKHFPSIDYTYTYDFQNRSNAEDGWLWSVTPAAFAVFQPSDLVSVSFKGIWKTYIASGENADFFPLKSHFHLSLGIHFLY
ncbi:MAG: hypothetical protein PWP06_1542 [Candidatus Marinimicrobia bacterium]|jgi:hypothetical protein|uniref:hypothetical protein n=1 Tax=Fidelibacter multiformis TaxID=3377529 RepID=UPI0029E218DD|nr:hypothetical protein [Candidatus Neomarinimicrobiota bacterium]